MADDRDAPPLAARRDDIRERRAGLERRLDDGYERIDQALRHGTDVTAWEAFWIQLLREYEAVCDDLRAAA